MRIKLNEEQINLLAQRLHQGAEKIQSDFSQLKGSYSSLDWDFGARVKLDNILGGAQRAMANTADYLYESENFIRKTCKAITEADNESTNSISMISMTFPKITSIGIGSCTPAAAVPPGTKTLAGLAGLVSGIPSAAAGWVSGLIKELDDVFISKIETYITGRHKIDEQQTENISEYIKSLNIDDESWNKMYLPDKQKILQDIENKAAEIQGRKNIQIGYEKKTDNSLGGYNRESQSIKLDNSVLNMGFYNSLEIILHEGRHAFQDGVADGTVKTPATSDTLAWSLQMNGKDIFNGWDLYHGLSDKFDRTQSEKLAKFLGNNPDNIWAYLLYKKFELESDIDYKLYRDQPVEADAFNYSQTIIHSLAPHYKGIG